MFYNVIIGTYEDLDKAKEAALDYWRKLFNSDKRNSAVEVRCYESQECNYFEYDVEYCLRWFNLSDLSDESLADVYENTDFYDYEMCKEITKRCDKFNEWMDADNENDELLDECVELLRKGA